MIPSSLPRAIVYDTSDPRLSPVWAAGARLYRRLGWVDLVVGSDDLREAVRGLPVRLEELQLWCHGAPGVVAWGAQRHGPSSLMMCLARLRPQTLWLRCCAYVCGERGRAAVLRVAQHLSCDVVAHTYDIGHWGMQSGTRRYSLTDNRMPWSASEGIAEGTPGDVRRIRSSHPFAPATVTALTPRAP